MSLDRPPPLKSVDGRTEVTTRRRLLHVPATVAAFAPLAILSADGTAQASPVTLATVPRRIRRAILVPRFGGDATADWYPIALRQLANLGGAGRVSVMIRCEDLNPSALPGVATLKRRLSGAAEQVWRRGVTHPRRYGLCG